MIVFPNSFIDSGKVINFSRPSDSQYRLTVEIGLSYDIPPGEAVALLRRVLDQHEGILDPSRNVVAIRSFDDSCIAYLLKFFVDDFAVRNKLKTEIYSCIWYELERSGYSVPYPVIDLRTQQSDQRLRSKRQQFIHSQSFDLLRSIDLFQSLSDEEINGIVCQDRALAFGPGEIIVVSGQVGGSMYVLAEGVCSVLIPDPSGGEHSVEISRLKRGMIFGEIAALTNAPRTASVRAIGHVRLQEISQQQIKDVFLKNETAMEAFAKVMTSREAAHRSFTPDQQKSFELSLIERMAQTFNKFFSK
jgi:CRP-like cAMP-binding protein